MSRRTLEDEGLFIAGIDIPNVDLPVQRAAHKCMVAMHETKRNGRSTLDVLLKGE